jgi:hypothetical protein
MKLLYHNKTTVMEIINVLFKGVELRVTPFCKPFHNEDKAREFILQNAEERGLTIMSSMGWNDNETIDDYRAEDAQGNSYYYVLYRQEIG